MPVSRLGKQSLTLSDKTVRRRDMQRLMTRENDADTPDTHQAMHLQTLQYDLDDVRGITDPRGMRGSSLSVDYTIVSGARTSLTNFREALILNHLDVDRFIHAGYAAGLACLGEEERDLGGAVIDMGGGTTSISIFMHGKLIYVDTVPVGGHRVTTDIARILSLPVADAERIKAIDGSVMPADLSGTPPASLSEVMRNGNSDNIVIPSQGDNIEIGGKSVERNLLSAIIRPRIEEIIELLTSRIQDARMQHAAGNRLLLTGGASQLTGLADLYAHFTQKTVVLGKPLGVDGLLDENSGPEFAAAIGALMHVSRLEENDPTDRQTRTLSYGPFERIGAWLRDNL
jgi:cell division protein FtsA